MVLVTWLVALHGHRIGYADCDHDHFAMLLQESSLRKRKRKRKSFRAGFDRAAAAAAARRVKLNGSCNKGLSHVTKHGPQKRENRLCYSHGMAAEMPEPCSPSSLRNTYLR